MRRSGRHAGFDDHESPHHAAGSTARPTLAERAFATLERFLHIKAASGIALLIAAAVAAVWANSPFAPAITRSGICRCHLASAASLSPVPLHFVINDGLMTIFFLVVGMEIRREIHEGARAICVRPACPSWRR